MNTRTLTPYVVAGLTVLLFLGNATNDANADGPYQPTWESLATYPIPDWFQDGKFGIYTHWGIYSVPAHVTEWYPHGMYMKDGFRNKDFYGWRDNRRYLRDYRKR